METKRKAKLIVNRNSHGTSNTFRVTIPSVFVREIGLGEDERDLEIEIDKKNNCIKIKKLLTSRNDSW